jgi:diguanylate cyclase (GGDEF)-like protein
MALAADPGPVRVLAVEDDPLSLAMIATVLEPIAEVVTAGSGEEALEALAGEDEFAAILLDVGLPGVDGFEVARIIKERPGSRHVPIIFLTGRMSDEEIRRGYAVGAVDYLLKPFEPEILQAKVSVFVDLAQLRRDAVILSHRSLHDPLTGLPNRTLFLDRLEHALARIARDPSLVGVLFLDLDGFKACNDRLGHSAGDRLLVELGTRLQESIRATDTAARFGGDEFLVLVEDLNEEYEIERLAGRVRDALSAPFEVDGEEVPLSAAIGMAATADPSARPEDLIRAADEAMLREKAAGRRPARAT